MRLGLLALDCLDFQRVSLNEIYAVRERIPPKIQALLQVQHIMALLRGARLGRRNHAQHCLGACADSAKLVALTRSELATSRLWHELGQILQRPELPEFGPELIAREASDQG